MPTLRRRIAAAPALVFAIALVSAAGCGPGGGGGVTAVDADGNPIGAVIDLDTHWADVYHAQTNAVLRINLTTGNVTGPGRDLTEFLQPFVYNDYFFTEDGCGEDLWRASLSDAACEAPPVGEIVALGADALGWEEGESVWVSGASAEEAVVPGEHVVTDGEGNLLCGDSPATGEVGLCRQVQNEFNDAVERCNAEGQTYDVWFNDSACEFAFDDGYDNTAFYTCLIDKFSVTDRDHTCEVDGEGNPTDVRQFEDTSQDADPPGCRELYNLTPDDTGGGPGTGGSYPTYQIGVETCAYQATRTEDVPTSYPAPIEILGL